ncbi:serine hydrolase domain-containing protein [Phytopseudomonas punonensis]|uniref:CubicO group peptidase, beta-lactamase class C family n=1 Tax=Phytopseudomonas punonensis TaxID=1220495 RepID=A0A1M7D7T2_9GAMM|nr:serine hydrolase domain-containing protein [Pseudomonas punonensis]SHL75525.1 CubicO group peptidase, beta-lactamase class C family [Pseudomonas punonensis]
MTTVQYCRSAILPTAIALLLSACTSSQTPPAEKPERIGRAQDFYELPQAYQAGTYRHMDELFFTRTVHRGPQVSPLPTRSEVAVQYEVDGQRLDVDAFMKRNQVSGLLIIKDGKVALEKYAMGNDANTRWTSFSVVKSISSTLVGAAVQQGKIASVNDPLTRYLPQLKGGAYDGVSVEQVLQMSSGVSWDETYRDPKSDRRRMFELQLANNPGALLKQMANLKPAHKPGTAFNYSTGESHLQSELIHAATGMTASDYLSERIWARLGMERDAFWQLDSRAGQEIGSSGLSATLRDYGRFGQFILDDGVINGERILPAGWLQRATRATPGSHLEPGKLYDGEYALGYGYQWWLFPTGAAALPNHDGGVFEAQGIFGQFLYINPAEKVIAVVWSTWPKPEMDEREMETYAFIGAAVNALR